MGRGRQLPPPRGGGTGGTGGRGGRGREGKELSVAAVQHRSGSVPTVRGDSPAPTPPVLAAASHPKHIPGVPQAGLGAAALIILFRMKNGKSGGSTQVPVWVKIFAEKRERGYAYTLFSLVKPKERSPLSR